MGSVAFGPFDEQLWLLLFATYVTAGITMWVIEGAKNQEDFPSGATNASGATDAIWEGVFRSLQSFVGGEAGPMGSHTRQECMCTLLADACALDSLHVHSVCLRQAKIIASRHGRGWAS